MSIRRVSRTLINRIHVPRRILSQEAGCGKEQTWIFKVRKFAFNWSSYNRYGLYTDDVIDYENILVKEALRRLPKDVLDARNFRIMRALQLDFLKIYLPKEKWTTYEEDLDNRYLKPYMCEIEAERNEIYEFGCVNYYDGDWPSQEVK